MLMNKKVVLAYSGSLDTSIAVQWLRGAGYDVVAVCIDVGDDKDLTEIKVKAIQVGAVISSIIYAKEEFTNDCAQLALESHDKDNDLLLSVLSRPFISKKLVEIAEQENAIAIAHGCTSEEDQVSFEMLIKALNPKLEVLAPTLDSNWSCEEKIAYAKEKNIPIPVSLLSERIKPIGAWN